MINMAPITSGNYFGLHGRTDLRNGINGLNPEPWRDSLPLKGVWQDQ